LPEFQHLKHWWFLIHWRVDDPWQQLAGATAEEAPVRATNKIEQPTNLSPQTTQIIFIFFRTYCSGYWLAISGQPRVLPDRGRTEFSGGDFEQLDPAMLVSVRDRLFSLIHILLTIHRANISVASEATQCNRVP
jgi:hypothetical protein